MKASIGRIVHYVLTADDAGAVNRRRQHYSAYQSESWPGGAQAHSGNHVNEGEHVPTVVTVAWENESNNGINGQVLLDGNDSLWVTSVQEGEAPGTWHWPERVE